MKGPAYRLVQKFGKTYQIRNATGSSARESAGYTDDGTIKGVMEQRGTPTTVTDSSGQEVEASIEIRCIIDGQTIIPAGVADTYPSVVIHPDGTEYRVMDKLPEDGGVDVLTVVR